MINLATFLQFFDILHKKTIEIPLQSMNKQVIISPERNLIPLILNYHCKGGQHMTRTEKETQKIRKILYPIIGETIVKTYFSYYGIFKNRLMFALYKNDNFYLKLSPEDINEALSYSGIEPLCDNKLTQIKNYYTIPNNILGNIIEYQHWIKNSLINIKQNKYQSYYQQKNKIRHLPNMNIHIERMLKKINIYTIEEVYEKGAINIFVELIKIGIDVSQMTLFKLYGAINKQIVYTLSTKTKKMLLLKADEALYQAGLRRRFKTI